MVFCRPMESIEFVTTENIQVFFLPLRTLVLFCTFKSNSVFDYLLICHIYFITLKHCIRRPHITLKDLGIFPISRSTRYYKLAPDRG